MSVVSFDKETRSFADLKKVGSWKYAEHPTTEVLCIGYAFDDEDPELWTPDSPEPTRLLDHVENGGDMAGWNIGGFDIPVWNIVLVPKYDWPPIRWEQALDTMAQAQMMHLPAALGQCAEFVGLPQDQQKDKRGKYLIQQLCKPKKSRKTGELSYREDPDLLAELFDYCKQDVVAERAVGKKLKPLPVRERRFWIATQRINERGVPIAGEEGRNILRVVEQEKNRLNDIAVKVTGGAFEKVSQLGKVKAWLAEQGALPSAGVSMDKEATTALLASDDLFDEERTVIEAYAAAGQSSVSKISKMLQRMNRDGTVKGEIVYHGAATGRDASKGVNMQNVVRPRIKDIALAHETLGGGDWELASMEWGDSLMDAAVACVRGIMKAPPGYRFLDADYSSIENRVGSWISGHGAKVEMFRQGLDEYRVFASTSLYRIPYDDVTDDQRQVSKSAVLGCMFGQGAKGLIEYAKGYGVELTQERSQEIVDAYREEYRPVQRMWYDCGDAALVAVQEPGTTIAVGKYIKFRCSGPFLMMRLPSGRILYWFKPRVEMRKTPWGEMRPAVTAIVFDSYTRRWRRSHIIGSSFYQSAVQATAADVMREGCLALEDAGYPLRLRVHDEFLAMLPEGEGTLDEMTSILERSPDWAPGLPVAAEGWEGPRFKK